MTLLRQAESIGQPPSHPRLLPAGKVAHVVPDAAAYPVHLRETLMKAMNAIIARNWDMAEPHWSASYTPFQPGFGLVLVEAAGSLVAFSVFRRLSLSGRAAVYQAGTEVLPAHQGQGLYAFLVEEMLAAAMRDGASGDLLLGWRTRNPIVWAANARRCAAVAPSLLDAAPGPDLQAAARDLAKVVHPGHALELPAMIMRGVYGHISHRPQPYAGVAALVHVAMQRLIPDSADALFSVGRIAP